MHLPEGRCGGLEVMKEEELFLYSAQIQAIGNSTAGIRQTCSS